MAITRSSKNMREQRNAVAQEMELLLRDFMPLDEAKERAHSWTHKVLKIADKYPPTEVITKVVYKDDVTGKFVPLNEVDLTRRVVSCEANSDIAAGAAVTFTTEDRALITRSRADAMVNLQKRMYEIDEEYPLTDITSGHTPPNKETLFSKLRKRLFG